MADSVPTSFVPQKPLQRDTRVRPSGDLVMGASVVLLVSSLLLAGGMFAWKWYLTRERDAKTEEVLLLRREVDQESVRQLSRLSERIRIGRELLESRTAPSFILSHLESKTVSEVRFKDFRVSHEPEGLKVKLTGEARDFNALAYEARILGENPLIKDQIFTNISVGEDGKVMFELTGSVDPSTVLAKNQFQTTRNDERVGQPPQPPSVSTSTPQTGTTTSTSSPRTP